MAFTAINNGDTGLSARTTLNEIITYLNGLGLDIEFSADNSAWHYGWASGDLYIRFSSDYGSTWSDGIYLSYSASGASGWDSVVWDDTAGNLNFYKGAVLDETVNIDGRYALTAAAQQSVYEITLPINGTLAGSIAAAVEGTDYPTGWILVANGVNLEIEHNLNRKSASIDVAYNYTGDWYRQIRGFNDGYQGHVYDSDNTIVEGIKNLYTAYKMRITILFK